MYVNNVQLEHANLDTAVQALKGAPFGPVRIGIAQPLPEGAEGHTEMMGQLRDKLASGGVSPMGGGGSIPGVKSPGIGMVDLNTNNTNSDVNTFSTEEV